jgi:hypothetical protein
MRPSANDFGSRAAAASEVFCRDLNYTERLAGPVLARWSRRST